MNKALTTDLMVDWSRVIEEARRGGFTLCEIANYTSIPKSSLLNYRNHGQEPRHSVGVVLIRFWSEVTKQNPDDAPLVPRMPSAAAYRR